MATAALSTATIDTTAANRPPLVLDVDGALLQTDLLHETAIAYVKRNPLRAFQILAWLVMGKATLKRKLSERVALDVANLPVNADLVAYAREQHAQGRQIGIATAADELLAHRLARQFEFVSFVVGSDGITNLKGPTKARRLEKEFPNGFSYAGDSNADLAVFAASQSIVIAGASREVTRKARRLGIGVEAEFPRERLGFRGLLKALRVHQWAKNALIFVPVILSGMADQPVALMHAAIAFIAMSLLASGTYLINDLMDLADDRAHWSKRERAIASGRLGIQPAVQLAVLLIGASFAACLYVGWESLLILAAYLTTTLAYSGYLKRLPIVDAFTLAALFTMRLGLGITAVTAEPSAWLLVFSMFLFASLSFAKRQTEIQRNSAKGQTAVSGRGYLVSDAGMVLALGVGTAIAAVTIMVLYIMHDVYKADFYSQPVLLWVFPAALFMWVCRIWLLCHRGQLNDDPVAFAIRDPVSIGLGGVMGSAFMGGWLL